jgi:hypothetical protein
MKKSFLSLFVLAAFTFASCKEEPKEITEPIDAAVASEDSNSFKVDTKNQLLNGLVLSLQKSTTAQLL